MSFPDPIKSALEGAGVSTTSLDRIRLAPRGVVGKASYVAAGAMAVLLATAIVLRDPAYLLAVAILAVVVFAIYLFGTLWFAHKNPGIALLEGAELIQWRQMDIAAKGRTITPALATQSEAPLQIDQPGGARG